VPPKAGGTENALIHTLAKAVRFHKLKGGNKLTSVGSSHDSHPIA
jgi:hypothetical protein